MASESTCKKSVDKVMLESGQNTAPEIQRWKYFITILSVVACFKVCTYVGNRVDITLIGCLKDIGTSAKLNVLQVLIPTERHVMIFHAGSVRLTVILLFEVSAKEAKYYKGMGTASAGSTLLFVYRWKKRVLKKKHKWENLEVFI